MAFATTGRAAEAHAVADTVAYIAAFLEKSKPATREWANVGGLGKCDTAEALAESAKEFAAAGGANAVNALMVRACADCRLDVAEWCVSSGVASEFWARIAVSDACVVGNFDVTRWITDRFRFTYGPAAAEAMVARILERFSDLLWVVPLSRLSGAQIRAHADAVRARDAAVAQALTAYADQADQVCH